MIEGVANSLKGQRYSYQRYGFPTWVSQLSRTKEARGATGELAATIGRKCHTSKARAIRDYIPFIKWMFTDREMSAKLTMWFNFSNDDLSLLTDKKNIKEIKKELEKLKPPPKPVRKAEREKKKKVTKRSKERVNKKKKKEESKEKIEKGPKIEKKVRKKLEKTKKEEEKPKYTLDKWL
jgi:replication factor C large subunit